MDASVTLLMVLATWHLAPCLLQNDRQPVHGQQLRGRLAAKALHGAASGGRVLLLSKLCR